MLIRSTALAALAAIAGGSAAVSQALPVSGPEQQAASQEIPATVPAESRTQPDAELQPAESAAATDVRPRKGEVRDPWEGLNRRLFATNLVIDKYTLEPAAKSYRAVTPRRLRRGISNMLANMRAPKNVANNLLQGRPLETSKSIFRFAINSTIGIGGFFDVAAKMGVQRREEDFGQTLAVWGVPSGPYLFVPLLGPSTVRDTLGAMVDNAFEPFNYLRFRGETPLRVSRFALAAVSGREGAIEAIESINSSAADPYTAFKAAYAQNRAFEIRNGKESFDDLPEFEEEEVGVPAGEAVDPATPDLPSEVSPETGPTPDEEPTPESESASEPSLWSASAWTGSSGYDIVPFVQESL